MPVSRSHLTRPKPRAAKIDLEGDELNIVFDSNKITPAWLREAEKRDAERDPLSLPKMLSEAMISWDVTEDDGSPFEPSADNIALFSYPAQRALLDRILQAAIPPSEEGNGSSNTLPTPNTDSSSLPESPQNGPPTSSLPEPSASPSPT